MALATNSQFGSIVLAGDLTGSSAAPQLRVSGVVPGEYEFATVVIDAKGRLIYAKSNTYPEPIPIQGELNGSNGSLELNYSGVSNGSYNLTGCQITAKGFISAATVYPLVFEGAIAGDMYNYTAPTELATKISSPGTFTQANIQIDAHGLITSVSSIPLDTQFVNVVTGTINGNTAALTLEEFRTSASYTYSPHMFVDSQGLCREEVFSQYVITGDVTGSSDGNNIVVNLPASGVTAGTYYMSDLSINSFGLVYNTGALNQSSKGIVNIYSGNNTGTDWGLSITGGVLSANKATSAAVGLALSENTNNIVINDGLLDVGPKVCLYNQPIVFEKFLTQPYAPYFNQHYGDITIYLCRYYYSEPNTSQSFTITPPDTYQPDYDIAKEQFDFELVRDPLPVTKFYYNGTGFKHSLVWNGTNWWQEAFRYDGTNKFYWCAKSFDGVNWTTHEMNMSINPNSVVWTGVAYLALKTDHTSFVFSSDGITWTTASTINVPYFFVKDPLWINSGKFIAFERPNSFTEDCNTVIVSDGTSWSRGTLPVTSKWTQMISILYNSAPKLIAISKDGHLAESVDDGATWTLKYDSFPLNSIAWSGTVLCAGSPDGKIFTCPTSGSWTYNWTLRYTVPSDNINDPYYVADYVNVIWLGNKFYAGTNMYTDTVGNSKSMQSISDVTGTTWTHQSMSGLVCPYYRVIWNGSYLYGNLETQTMHTKSVDGLNWTQYTPPNPPIIGYRTFPVYVEPNFNATVKFSNTQTPAHSRLSVVTYENIRYCTFY